MKEFIFKKTSKKLNFQRYFLLLDFILSATEEIECDFRKKIKTESEHRESAGRVSKLDHIDSMIYHPTHIKLYFFHPGPGGGDINLVRVSP